MPADGAGTLGVTLDGKGVPQGQPSVTVRSYTAIAADGTQTDITDGSQPPPAGTVSVSNVLYTITWGTDGFANYSNPDFRALTASCTTAN
jgi:hypothetical protein